MACRSQFIEKSFKTKLLNNLKNPLTDPIRFKLWPQLSPSDLLGQISNSRTRPKVLISSIKKEPSVKIFFSCYGSV